MGVGTAPAESPMPARTPLGMCGEAPASPGHGARASRSQNSWPARALAINARRSRRDKGTIVVTARSAALRIVSRWSRSTPTATTRCGRHRRLSSGADVQSVSRGRHECAPTTDRQAARGDGSLCSLLLRDAASGAALAADHARSGALADRELITLDRVAQRQRHTGDRAGDLVQR
jgi:hypothetical protein